MRIERLVMQVTKTVPDDGTDLYRIRINGDILRSHVNYDKTVLLLAAIRDINVSKGKESEWIVIKYILLTVLPVRHGYNNNKRKGADCNTRQDQKKIWA